MVCGTSWWHCEGLGGFYGTTKKNRLTFCKELINCIQHMKITYTVKIDDEGDKRWYHKKKLHREDGPAIEYANGSKFWYHDGKRHRTDGPAVDYANGNKNWYRNDKLHREDGPAVENANGTKFWYHDGKRHRTDGPAIEWADGNKYWYVDGKRHRTDGPAIEWTDGTKYWYLDDVQLTEAQWRKRVAKPNCEGKVVEVDGVQYKLVAL
jgi:hypothetical protein